MSWISAHLWQFAGGIVAILLAALAWAHLVTIPGLENRLELEETAHQQTKDNYRFAAMEAEIAHRRALDAAEAGYVKLAEKADEKIEQARGNAMAAAERHIAANRVRCEAGAVAGATGRAVAPASGGGAASGDRSGSLPELVGVQADDVRICTENTMRLRVARDWGLAL